MRWWRGRASPACRRLSMTCTAPFTAARSRRPSLSKSSHAVPKPVNPRLAGPKPDGALRSSNSPEPSLTKRLLPSPVNSVTKRSSSPSSSKSPASTPMLASALPVTGSATPGQQRRVLERAVAPVHPQLVLLAVIGDVDVDPPVPIEVGGGQSKAGSVLARDAGGDADVGEGAIPAVEVQPAGQRLVAVGRAVVPRARGAGARRVVLQAVTQVAGDVQIQPSVPVDVHKRRGRAPGRMVGSATRRPIREGAVAVVVPQLVGRVELGQVQIDAPVVVDVARGDAHPVAAGSDAGKRLSRPRTSGARVPSGSAARSFRKSRSPDGSGDAPAAAAATSGWPCTRYTSRSPSLS